MHLRPLEPRSSLSSFHRRIASRLRFREYLSRYRAGSKGQPEAQAGPKAGQASLAGAAVPRALPAPGRPSRDARAGARGAVAGDALEADPAGRDQGRDRLRHAGPAAAGAAHVAGCPFAIPESPKAPAGRCWWRWSCWSRCWASSSGCRAAGRPRGRPSGSRSRCAARSTSTRCGFRLHRVYQLKSGGASSLLREDAGGVGELIFSMLYNPWQAVVQFLGGLVVLAWVDWRLLLGALLAGAGRLLFRPALEPPHPPVVPRRPQGAPGDRQPDDRGLRRHARGAGLRPAEERIGAVHGREPLHGAARAARLVAVAADRAALGVPPADGLGRRSCSTAACRSSTAGSRSAT